MPIWFIQAISFIWPVTVRQFESKFSGHLFIRYFMGKKILDTRMTNYSFGGLQKVLKRSLELLPFNPNTQNILILGFGAGSVLETIRRQHLSNAKITGVDIDEVVFSIAKEEFKIEEGSNTRFVVADATDWIKYQSGKYNLIIIDIFIIDTLPSAATEFEFIDHITRALAPEGQLIFNTIPETLPHKELEAMIDHFENLGVSVRKMRKWGYSNNIILGKKSALLATQPVE